MQKKQIVEQISFKFQLEESNNKVNSLKDEVDKLKKVADKVPGLEENLEKN